MNDHLSAHRAFYDAVETGDVDLMASLWVDDPDTSCIHITSPPKRNIPEKEPISGQGLGFTRW